MSKLLEYSTYFKLFQAEKLKNKSVRKTSRQKAVRINKLYGLLLVDVLPGAQAFLPAKGVKRAKNFLLKTSLIVDDFLHRWRDVAGKDACAPG